jgi:hypothetical protein
MEKNDFPKDPLERCHMRWSNLFWGVYGCLFKKDPALARGLKMALEREGIYLHRMHRQVFAMNPSDEILERLEKFKKNGIIPKLRRTTGQKSASPLDVFNHYSHLFFCLKNLPKDFKKLRNPYNKRRMLKNRLEGFSKIHRHFKAISDDKLIELCNFSKTPRRMTLELLAEFYGETLENMDKLLDRARKDFPEYVDAYK